MVDVGREAIRALWEKVLAAGPAYEPEEPLPALVSGDIPRRRWSPRSMTRRRWSPLSQAPTPPPIWAAATG
ncbi:MAG: hypothetical protein ACYDH5_13660 [Acidimicrobiales bacterium]